MIDNFDFILPTKICYGRGRLEVLGEELRRLQAANVMVITDPGLVRAGLVDRIGYPRDAIARAALRPTTRASAADTIFSPRRRRRCRGGIPE